jgi:uncharacterized protein
MKGNLEVHAFRLKPHEDLKVAIIDFAKTNQISAGIILTSVGSLEQFHIRFANEKAGKRQSGFFEIVSLVGTFSASAAHLHICVSDDIGNTVGGHLLDGNHIYTTAEIVVGIMPDLSFERELDPTYGFSELVVKRAG